MKKKTTAEIKAEQEERALKFPKNRIAFRRNDWNTATEDQKVFRRWVHGEINMPTLCKLIASNNHLPRVTETQMIKELEETGWLRK